MVLAFTLFMFFSAVAPLPVGGASAEVRVAGGQVTIKAESVPLVDLLREIARKAGIAMSLRGQTGQVITADIENAPIGEALDILLRQNPGSALVYAGESESERQLIKAYVVLRGQGALTEEFIPASVPSLPPPQAPMPIVEADEKLRAGSIEDFLQSLGTLYPHQKTMDALYAALRHSDPRVRVNALSVLAEVGTGPQVQEAMEDLANDRDETVSSLAQRLLGRVPEPQ